MTSNPEDQGLHVSDDPDANEARGDEATSFADPSDDPAQREWEETEAVEEGSADVSSDPDTATGADPDEIPDPADEIPEEDLPDDEEQPETQDDDPVVAELGEDGQGDLGPADL